MGCPEPQRWAMILEEHKQEYRTLREKSIDLRGCL